ncbi:MAG: hypothetical protein K0R49_450, partial [Burkholderiales bacterium]|nr:hypothetical protein [Burkholderiales bacterium]
GIPNNKKRVIKKSTKAVSVLCINIFVPNIKKLAQIYYNIYLFYPNI